MHRYRQIDFYLFIYFKNFDFSNYFRLFFEVDPTTYLILFALMTSYHLSQCTGNHEQEKDKSSEIKK